MSKPDFLQDSDDDDIWDYQPRQRFPRASHQKQSSQLKSSAVFPSQFQFQLR